MPKIIGSFDCYFCPLLVHTCYLECHSLSSKCFSSHQAALLTKLTFYACISSELLAPLWFSDVVHNAQRWILKARVGKKFCRVHLTLNQKKSSGWMVFQTASATQKRSKNGGQITTIIKDTKRGNSQTRKQNLSISIDTPGLQLKLGMSKSLVL